MDAILTVCLYALLFDPLSVCTDFLDDCSLNLLENNHAFCFSISVIVRNKSGKDFLLSFATFIVSKAYPIAARSLPISAISTLVVGGKW